MNAPTAALPPEPILTSPESLKVINSLITTSHRSFIEVESVLPWADGIDKTIIPKLPETSWIYGTKYWDALTEEQRMEVMWLETARDVTMFTVFETFLPRMYVGYINQHGDALPKEIYEYLMIFSKEEVVHTLMFNRYMKLANLPRVKNSEAAYLRIFEDLSGKPPVFGIFATLVVEWAAELNAMYGTQSEANEPLTRKLFRAHHVEEIRHMAFGKRIVEDFVKNGDPEQVQYLRTLFAPIIDGLLAEFTFNRAICDLTSFKYPIDKDDEEAIAEIRNTENNKRLNKLRFKELNDWLDTLGLA